MAYSVINTGSITNTTQSSQTFAFSCTGGTSGERVLVVVVGTEDNDATLATRSADPTSVTYNGVSLTKATSDYNDSGTIANVCSLWYLANPATGSNTLAVTWASAKDDLTIEALLLSGVSEAAPEATNIGNGGSATSASPAVTTVTADAAVVYGMIQSGTTALTPSGLTEELDIAGASSRVGMGDEAGPSTPGSATGTWSWSGSARYAWVAAAWALAATIVTVPALSSSATLPTHTVSGPPGPITLPALSSSATLPSHTIGLDLTVTVPALSGSATGPSPTVSVAPELELAALLGSATMPALSVVLASAGGGSNPNAKRDTRFYGESDAGTWATLATDLSQEGVNLTAGTSWLYENTTGRVGAATTPPWCWEFRVSLQTGSSIYLVNHFALGDGYTLQVTGGNVILETTETSFQQSIWPITLAGSPEDFIFSLSAEPNPYTTGASDAVRYWVSWWNLSTGVREMQQHDGESISSDASGNVSVGANSSAGPGPTSCTLKRVRWSSHHHGAGYEAYRDFGGAPTDDTRSDVVMEVPFRVPRASWCDDGDPAGPLYSAVAASLRRGSRRLAGPLVNMVPQVEVGISQEYGGTYPMPGGDGFYATYQLARRVPVPPGCNRLWVRLYIDKPSAEDAEGLRVRVYSLDYWPVAGAPSGVAAGPAATRPSSTTWRKVESTIADGVRTRIVLGMLEPAVDPDGWTYLFVACDSSTTTATVEEWVVEPYLVDAAAIGPGDIVLP